MIRRILLFLAILCICVPTPRAQQIQTQSVSLSQSGAAVVVQNTLQSSGSLTVTYVISGAPATMTLLFQGQTNAGGTSVLDTYSGTANTTRTISLSGTIFPNYLIAATWTGGNSVTVTATITGTGVGPAQPPINGPAIFVQGTTAPTGTCLPNSFYENTQSSTYYNCVNAAWTQISGGGSANAMPFIIQSALCSTGAANCTNTRTLTAGNHVLAECFTSTPSATLSISDTINTYNVVLALTTQGTFSREIWEADNVAGGSTGIVCTCTSGADDMGGWMIEVNDGANTGSMIDQLATPALTSATANLSNTTGKVLQLPELALGIFTTFSASTASPATGFSPIPGCPTLVWGVNNCNNSTLWLPTGNLGIGVEVAPVNTLSTVTVGMTLNTSGDAITDALTLK